MIRSSEVMYFRQVEAIVLFWSEELGPSRPLAVPWPWMFLRMLGSQILGVVGSDLFSNKMCIHCISRSPQLIESQGISRQRRLEEIDTGEHEGTVWPMPVPCLKIQVTNN